MCRGGVRLLIAQYYYHRGEDERERREGKGGAGVSHHAKTQRCAFHTRATWGQALTHSPKPSVPWLPFTPPGPLSYPFPPPLISSDVPTQLWILPLLPAPPIISPLLPLPPLPLPPHLLLPTHPQPQIRIPHILDSEMFQEIKKNHLWVKFSKKLLVIMVSFKAFSPSLSSLHLSQLYFLSFIFSPPNHLPQTRIPHFGFRCFKGSKRITCGRSFNLFFKLWYP